MSFISHNDDISKDQFQKELIQNAIIHFAQTGNAFHFNQKKKSNLNYVVIFMTVGFIVSSYFLWTFNVNTMEQKDEIKTGYDVQNLRGDTVDTWLTWRIHGSDLFHVHVEKSDLMTDKTTQAIFDVIMSWDVIEIDDSLQHKGPLGSSTYYKGWYGALQSISDETLYQIPQNLHFHVTEKGEGDILITLTDRSNPDGYNGYTLSIVDENNHQILKSKITIYDANKISIEELKTILRHELGHGFGLAHSTAPEDLMHPTIKTNYPYISPCDIDALIGLYNGKTKSQVVCEK